MKMQGILTIIVLFVGIATAEVPGNPDRYTSFALTYQEGSLSGIGTSLERFGWLAIPTAIDTTNEMEVKVIRPELRIPMNRRVTLDINWTYLMQEYQFIGKNGHSHFSGDLRGGIWGGTFRLYMNK